VRPRRHGLALLGGPSTSPLGSMSNGFLWAAVISGAALISGYVLATPGILILHRRSAPNALWMYAVLPLTIAAWWCAYWLGLGAQSPFNTQELFVLAAVHVLAVYALLILGRRFQRHAALPGALAAVCISAVLLLRLLTPTIGE
jgi:hypothetical protein